MLFRYLTLFFALVLQVSVLQAGEKVALVGKGELTPIKKFVMQNVKTYEYPVAELCANDITVMVINQADVAALDRQCSIPPKIFVVALSATDALLARPKVSGFFGSSSLASQLSAAQTLVVGAYTVLYSEQAELKSIQQFRQKHPEQELNLIKVSSASEAVKALGRNILKSSAVILGGNPDIFNDAFLLTARKMSLKFLTPLVGGSSAEQLKKGTVFGMFVSDEQAIEATQAWLKTGRATQPLDTLITNQKMMGYFGLVLANE